MIHSMVQAYLSCMQHLSYRDNGIDRGLVLINGFSPTNLLHICSTSCCEEKWVHFTCSTCSFLRLLKRRTVVECGHCSLKERQTWWFRMDIVKCIPCRCTATRCPATSIECSDGTLLGQCSRSCHDEAFYWCCQSSGEVPQPWSSSFTAVDQPLFVVKANSVDEARGTPHWDGHN